MLHHDPIDPDTLPARIRAKLCVLTGSCWLWKGAGSGNGYGKVSVSGRMHMAHRHVWELYHGPVPPGLVLNHLCRRRACCNPAHLELVTVQENTRRGLAVLFQAPLPTSPSAFVAVDSPLSTLTFQMELSCP